MREAAAAAAANSDWSAAVLDRFRAIVRGVEERLIVDQQSRQDSVRGGRGGLQAAPRPCAGTRRQYSSGTFGAVFYGRSEHHRSRLPAPARARTERLSRRVSRPSRCTRDDHLPRPSRLRAWRRHDRASEGRLPLEAVGLVKLNAAPAILLTVGLSAIIRLPQGTDRTVGCSTRTQTSAPARQGTSCATTASTSSRCPPWPTQQPNSARATHLGDC